MYTAMLICLVLIALAVNTHFFVACVASAFLPCGIPQPYRCRACQGKNWQRAFPTASKEDIRNFLAVFVNAFVFSDSQKLNFHPDDTILAVYRALYPANRWLPVIDMDELETLEEIMETDYGLSLRRLWNENEHLTLGELFAATRQKA
ncbi:MAG: hypothetical protein LBU53_04060 [Zoogloeaceae bacterium]|jgi:hypothetical protein|nr:hypothetical protein [Zoogloeaceae bacterium]